MIYRYINRYWYIHVKDVTAEWTKYLHAGSRTRKLVKNADLNRTWLAEQIGNKEREQMGKCVADRRDRFRNLWEPTELGLEGLEGEKFQEKEQQDSRMGRIPEVMQLTKIVRRQSGRLNCSQRGLNKESLEWHSAMGQEELIFVARVIQSSGIHLSRTYEDRNCSSRRVYQILQRSESCSTSGSLSKQHESMLHDHSPLCVQCLPHSSA